jgi:hypothetical protein
MIAANEIFGADGNEFAVFSTYPFAFRVHPFREKEAIEGNGALYRRKT